jgi:hypothetical protein
MSIVDKESGFRSQESGGQTAEIRRLLRVFLRALRVSAVKV